MKQPVITLKLVASLLGQAGDQLNKNSAPSLVLGYPRQLVKAYVAFFPGAGFLVDRVFDAITHAEEAKVILNKAYLDFFEVIRVLKGDNENQMENARAIFAPNAC